MEENCYNPRPSQPKPVKTPFDQTKRQPKSGSAGGKLGGLGPKVSGGTMRGR